jgi:hypothetical protein
LGSFAIFCKFRICGNFNWCNNSRFFSESVSWFISTGTCVAWDPRNDSKYLSIASPTTSGFPSCKYINDLDICFGFVDSKASSTVFVGLTAFSSSSGVLVICIGVFVFSAVRSAYW